MNNQLKVLFVFLLLLNFDLFAQSTSQKILGTFILNKLAYDYEFKKEEESKFSLRINKTGVADANGSVIFSDFDQSNFTDLFEDFMESKLSYSPINDSELSDKAKEIFYKIKARLDFIDDEPITAYLILKKNYAYSYLTANSSNYYKGDLGKIILKHNVKEVDIETEDGAIKNISVNLDEFKENIIGGTSSKSFLQFKNIHPISISGKFDPEKLSNALLYCFDCYGIKGVTRFIRLSEVIMIDISYENDKEDYSPTNKTFSLTPMESIVELRKEKRSRIMEVAAFSDFVGLDQENPNGLIQIEAKRKININTRYHTMFRKADKHLTEKLNFTDVDTIVVEKVDKKRIRYEIKYKISSIKNSDTSLENDGIKYIYIPYKEDSSFTGHVIKGRRLRPNYYNFFGSIEPRLLFSKLEENNRYLVLDSLSSSNSEIVGGIVPINPIELFRHQLASFGLNLNVFKFSFPQLKFSISLLDVGYYWYRTRVQLYNDTEASSTIPLNSQFWQFGSSFHFKPDSRWGVNFGVNYIKQEIWNESFALSNSNGLLQTTFDAHLKTSNYAKLFFRFRWNQEYKNKNNNFTQFQLGYSLDLFSSGYGIK